MALDTLARLGTARELQRAEARAKESGAADRRLMFLRKAAALRALLLGRRAAAGGVEALDLFNPSEALPILRDYMGSLASEPPEVQARAGAYLSIIANYLAHFDSLTGHANMMLGAKVKAQAQDLAAPFHTDPARLQTFAAFKADGAAAAQLPEGVAAARAELMDLIHGADGRRRESHLRHQARIKTIDDRYLEAISRARQQWRNGTLSEEDYQYLVSQYEAETTRAFDDARAQNDDFDREEERKSEIREAMVAHGRAVIAAALERSPVTQEQAEAWAASQQITKAAAARLKRDGYPVEQVRADMAEFYRLTGGRLATVIVQSSGARRASASQIHGHKSSIINLGAGFDKRVLFHELAHHLEADPQALAAANGFLLARRESNTTYRLRDLTGNRGYASDERAYKDSWFNPYIGKVYEGATEVMSMGVESFCDPFVLTDRIAQDPEHFAMVLGYLQSQPHPLYRAVKDVFAQAAEAEDQASEARDAEREQYTAQLAAAVEFVKLETTPEIVAGILFHLTRSPTEYIGSWETCHAFEGKFRDKRTGREKRGIALLFDRGADGGGFTWFPVFDGLERAKVEALAFVRHGARIDATNPQSLKALSVGLAPV